MYLLACKQKLCDQLRRSRQASTRPVMDSVRPRESEKVVDGGQRAEELKIARINSGHISKARAMVILLITSVKKAGAGLIAKAPRVGTTRASQQAQVLLWRRWTTSSKK
ncbi:hypothetical protein PoB_007036900 [Plakobranchus ocellatus]|uniref:Uncharacterized protein n=1 Tax=Plakobranchus ocellatus TaxID=259542 RepID=A0AAV4DI03_9GAST|nr:hypothetical protein PoB_007036900 [Plakobranchus ocellatus]